MSCPSGNPVLYKANKLSSLAHSDVPRKPNLSQMSIVVARRRVKSAIFCHEEKINYIKDFIFSLFSVIFRRVPCSTEAAIP
jgi:hypothetical protein